MIAYKKHTVLKKIVVEAEIKKDYIHLSNHPGIVGIILLNVIKLHRYLNITHTMNNT